MRNLNFVSANFQKCAVHFGYVYVAIDHHCGH
jgi:hypothetical protein